VGGWISCRYTRSIFRLSFSEEGLSIDQVQKRQEQWKIIIEKIEKIESKLVNISENYILVRKDDPIWDMIKELKI